MLTIALVVAAASAAPAAPSARPHAFSATYSGHGHGQVDGTKAFGSAVLNGRGKLIGPGTLSGSVTGAFVSRTCVDFSGTGVLKGKATSLKLAAHGASACASGNPDTVVFSGTARVVSGTAAFKGAHGTLRFAGTYLRDSQDVTISFLGELSY